MTKKLNTGTLCVQGGWQPKKGEARVLPIFQSTTFKYETSEQMDMNNVTLLANLISKFRKKGDEAQAKRLYDILSKCVERCTVAHKNTD